jgi:hypothetical protein
MFVSNDLMLSPFTFARHHSVPKSSSSRCSRTDHIKLVIVYLQVALFGHGLGALSVRLTWEHFHLDNIPASFFLAAIMLPSDVPLKFGELAGHLLSPPFCIQRLKRHEQVILVCPSRSYWCRHTMCNSVSVVKFFQDGCVDWILQIVVNSVFLTVQLSSLSNIST